MIPGEVFEWNGVQYFADNAFVRNGESCCHRRVENPKTGVFENVDCAFKNPARCPPKTIFPCNSERLPNGIMTRGLVAGFCWEKDRQKEPGESNDKKPSQSES